MMSQFRSEMASGIGSAAGAPAAGCRKLSVSLACVRVSVMSMAPVVVPLLSVGEEVVAVGVWLVDGGKATRANITSVTEASIFWREKKKGEKIPSVLLQVVMVTFLHLKGT